MQAGVSYLCQGGRGVARNLFRRGTKPGDWIEVPQRGPGPGGGLGAKPPEAEHIYANNHSDNVLIKTTNFFQHGNFREGHVPLVLPFPMPLQGGIVICRVCGWFVGCWAFESDTQ